MLDEEDDLLVEPLTSVEKPSFEGIFDEDKVVGSEGAWATAPKGGSSSGKIILSNEVQLPPEIAYHKVFITGASGSGKSWTVGVMCEEFSRLGLQFVLFDALGAHGGLKNLDNVVEVSPDMEKTVNVERLVDEVVSNPDVSLVVNLSHVDDNAAAEIVAEYADELFKRRLGRALMTVIEECQDLVPQSRSSVKSHGPIIKLCKKGRQYGYGVMLVSQRPHEVDKAALTQCSIHIIHNVIQTRDLIAVENQISQGVDKKPTRMLLDKIRSFEAGECLVYSPDFVPKMAHEANIHHIITKVRANRTTEHSGDNVVIELQGGKVWYPTNPQTTKSIGGMQADIGEDNLLSNRDLQDSPKGGDFTFDDEEDFGHSKPYEYDRLDEAWVADLDLEPDNNSNPELRSKITGYGFVILLASGMYLLLKPNLNPNAA